MLNLNLSLNLSWGGTGLFLGEVEGRGMAAWADRLRSPAGGQALLVGVAGESEGWGKGPSSSGLRRLRNLRFRVKAF
ncbi:hypothetical protein IX84_20015 [Phaeodactylibacter xiamenensis]|uniref:Uncharacterized protein n=1 Tax=Phaeodactylibacter xiamenensis TaxID=1524460 RepID=A0A098S4L8_9BACT|nr:hypothetical protein IX84_20015 [Phaeodactylibacter xiamenensis]